jgi:plastocyanin
MNPQEPQPINAEPAANDSRLMGRKRLVALCFSIVLIVIAVAIFLVVNHSNQPRATTATITHGSTKPPVVVQISDSGFSPSALSISKGTTVQWTNTDTTIHQVAADPYPKDNSINGFDSTIQLNQADTLSFTFNKPGTYTYHDEKNPLKFKGTIVVK